MVIFCRFFRPTTGAFGWKRGDVGKVDDIAPCRIGSLSQTFAPAVRSDILTSHKVCAWNYITWDSPQSVGKVGCFVFHNVISNPRLSPAFISITPLCHLQMFLEIAKPLSTADIILVCPQWACDLNLDSEDTPSIMQVYCEFIWVTSFSVAPLEWFQLPFLAGRVRRNPRFNT